MKNSVQMRIAALNLDAIKEKLMDSESGEGWPSQRANAVEIEYRRFLCLMKAHPTDVTSPFLDVDTFWHYHILDTQKYAADCEYVFGYFLHHVPSLSTSGSDATAVHQHAGDRMRKIYEQMFGSVAGPTHQSADYQSGEAASVSRQTETGYCGVAASASRQTETAYCGVAASASPQSGTAYCGATASKPARRRLAAWSRSTTQNSSVHARRPPLAQAA